MKRYGNLITKICDFYNLVNAYKQTSRGKKHKRYTYLFYRDLEKNLFHIREDLQQQTYRWGRYTCFEVTDNKRRLINAPAFRDRVTQHAINNIIEPIFDKNFIHHSYACRRKKGTHLGVKNYRRVIQDPKMTWTLKCDIKSFFRSINREKLLEIIAKKIKDKALLYVLKKLIFYDKNSAGIPIGNLLSQLFANIYLNELDKYMKHDLKIKHYLRYMDDFIIIGSSKTELQGVRDKIRDFLMEKLYLTLHPNKQHIMPIKNGVTWLGYRVFKTRCRVANRNIRSFRRWWKGVLAGKVFTDDYILARIVAFFALAKHASSLWILRDICLKNKTVFSPKIHQKLKKILGKFYGYRLAQKTAKKISKISLVPLAQGKQDSRT